MENGSIRQLLHNRHVAIVDGAMATELEKHGVDTSGELWSAAALLHQRQAIYDVHMSYLEAGADFATTNTYQRIPSIRQHRTERKRITDADRAGSARSQTRVRGLVAAAPLPSHAVGGRKRRPVWRVSGGRQRIHRRLRVERATIPGLPSRSHAGHGRIRRGPVRIRNHAEHWRSEGLDRSPTGRIPEHDSMAVVQPVRKWRYGGWHGPGRSRLLHPERAANRSVGVNCVPMDRVLPAIRAIRQVTDKPIIVYPNNGDIYDPKTKTWSLIPPVPNRPSPIWYCNGSTREPDSLEDAAERLQTISEP